MQKLISDSKNLDTDFTPLNLNDAILFVRKHYLFNRFKLYAENTIHGVEIINELLQIYLLTSEPDLHVLFLFLLLVDLKPDIAEQVVNELPKRDDIPLSSAAAKSFKLALLLAS